MYDFDKMVDRVNSDCCKWDERQLTFGNPDLIPLWVADMDFEVLPELQEAMKARAAHPTYGYTFASPEYYEAIFNWNRERNGLELKKEELIPVPGVVTALGYAVHALTEPKDKIMVFTPVYNPFFEVVELSGRQLVKSPLLHCGSRFEIDFDNMEAQLKNGVKMVILCSPHNPVGRVWTLEEMTKVVDLCDQYGAYLFSDEIHSDIIFKGHKHHSLYTVSPKAEKIGIVAMAPSKTFNIAGLKSSLIIIKNPEIRKKVKNWVDSFHTSLDLFAYKATEIVYAHGAQWCDELNDYLLKNAEFVDQYLKENLPKVRSYVPEGTYLMWLDFSAYGLSQDELMHKMAFEANVGLNSGDKYGEEGQGFVRFNIGCPRFLLEKALNQIKDVFSQL